MEAQQSDAPTDDNGEAAPLQQILKTAEDSSDGEKTTVGDIIDAFGAASLGPVLILFGLLTFFPPIGAVPGVPIVLATILILYTLQFVVGRPQIWLPGRLRRMSLKRDKIGKAQKKLEPALRRIDLLFRERLTTFTGPKSARLASIAVLLHALLMIPLEFVSLVSIPGAALVFFGVALTARDGLMMLLGWTVTIGAVLASVFLVPWGRLPWF